MKGPEVCPDSCEETPKTLKKTPLYSEDVLLSLQFSDGLDRAELLSPEESLRTKLLRSSLQVLSSSGALMRKLKLLQSAEALQRRGGVLQGEEEEEEEEEEGEEVSWSSGGAVLRLVEDLQDRRRRTEELRLHRGQRVRD
ncbi:hypothetical protein NQZ68_012868 [Dissostichus eleginoides]|nr:hypothetical protein NQZ68_012868 [Dissostichus eleginoides]